MKKHTKKDYSLVKLAFWILLIEALIFLGSTKAHAHTSIEAIFGGLTYHVMDPDSVSGAFSNKISPEGRLIYTGLLGVGITDENVNYRIFVGQNSIGEQMFGSMISWTYKLGPIRLGPVVGFYQQDDTKYILKGIKPFSLGFGIVPIAGADLSVRLFSFDGNKYVKLNTILSPVIFNETVSVGWDLW